MAYEKKDNSGALFKNDKKDKDTHPDYRGDIKIDGVEYWLSAWIKPTKNVTKFMSLSAQVKDGQFSNGVSKANHAPQKPLGNTGATQGSGFSDMEDDIPF